MFIANVYLVTAVDAPVLFGVKQYEAITQWAEKHHATVHCEAHEGKYNVILTDCNLSIDEFDDAGMLQIGSFLAYVGNGYHVSDKVKPSFADMLKAFIEELFVKNNFTEDEQQAIWNMKLSQFVSVADDTVTMSAPVEEQGRTSVLSKRMLLSYPKEIVCPECNVKGALSLVEGNVVCTRCHASFGDIDDIAD